MIHNTIYNGNKILNKFQQLYEYVYCIIIIIVWLFRVSLPGFGGYREDRNSNKNGGSVAIFINALVPYLALPVEGLENDLDIVQ